LAEGDNGFVTRAPGCVELPRPDRHRAQAQVAKHGVLGEDEGLCRRLIRSLQILGTD
jgi:hypothetical protein